MMKAQIIPNAISDSALIMESCCGDPEGDEEKQARKDG
jgi:hypothetical protein